MPLPQFLAYEHAKRCLADLRGGWTHPGAVQGASSGGDAGGSGSSGGNGDLGTSELLLASTSSKVCSSAARLKEEGGSASRQARPTRASICEIILECNHCCI